MNMGCEHLNSNTGSNCKLCKLREKYGSCTPNENKWISNSRRYDYCESSWKYRECPDYIKRG